MGLGGFTFDDTGSGNSESVGFERGVGCSPTDQGVLDVQKGQAMRVFRISSIMM
jgi:hypothetical protein